MGEFSRINEALLAVQMITYSNLESGANRPLVLIDDDHDVQLRQIQKSTPDWVLWLSNLDLHLPLVDTPESAILTRIYKLSGNLLNESYCERSEGSCDRDWLPSQPRCLLALRRLMADAARTNVAARAGHLDPGSYGHEVVRAEEGRMIVQQSSARVVREVASGLDSYLLGPHRYHPIFILPVELSVFCDARAADRLMDVWCSVRKVLRIPHLVMIVHGVEELMPAQLSRFAVT